MEERTLTSHLLPAGERAGGVSSARARTTTRTLLARLGVPAAGVDDVVIVVTELVSNAIRHAGGVTGFAITARPGTGTVTVEVSDRVSRVPELRTPAPGRPGGFGWRVVHDLTDTVRISTLDRNGCGGGGGKTVTVTFTGERLGFPGA